MKDLVLSLVLLGWAAAAFLLTVIVARVGREQVLRDAPWNDDWALWAAGV